MTMTPDELRSLDAEIAVKVFGYANVRFVPGHSWGWFRDPTTEERASYARNGVKCEYVSVDRYSTEISWAWSVISKLWATGAYAEIEVRRYFAYRSGEACVMCEIKRKEWTVESGTFCAVERVSNEPLAICRAALAAVARDGGADADSYKLNPGGQRA